MEDKSKEALYWVQDYLARRSHSEKELREKLLKKDFEDTAISEAISYAKEHNWMDDPHELAERVYNEWDLKNKSHTWIFNYLNKKGLPVEIEKNQQRETEKVLAHLKKKFPSPTREDYQKAGTQTSSKGFQFEEFKEAWEQWLVESKQETP